jgi:hypothetical protein
MGNASVDDTDAANTFFATDDKTYLCLSILTFIIWVNIERLSNSSIYVLQWPSSSAGHEFADVILNMVGSGEVDDGGNGNDGAPWWVVLWYMTKYCVVMTMYCCEDYGLSWTMSKLVLSLLYISCDLFWRLPNQGGSQNKLYILKTLTIFIG